MGYISVSTNYLNDDMLQTPMNIYTVRECAGWNCEEVSKELGIDPEIFRSAENGFKQLPDSIWKELINIAGNRAFDHEVD